MTCPVPATTVDFFRTLRHDLRTPINHVVGYSELLLEEADDAGRPDLGPDLRRIHTAGKELLAVVNDILEPAKVEAGRVDLDRLTRELRTPLNTIIGYSDLLQEEAQDGGLDSLVPDLQRINAAGKHLLGLVTAVLDLYRLDLAPVRDVAAGPAPPADAERLPTIAARDGDAARPPTLEGVVLVVDDNEANRDMLSRRLERLGYTVAVAEDGRTALERVRSEPFDLILLDIRMPGLDGYQVLRYLKADDALRHIPVIVLSSVDEVDSAVTCIELGAEDYLPKPFDSVLLRARISASLEKKRLRDREAMYLRQIEAEKRRADELLHVILPAEIVAELKATNSVQPRRYENVAILFCDIVDFTAYCDRREPAEVIPYLQELTEAYEEIVLRHGLQKIKTIGDAFMAVAGLLTPAESPVLSCVCCAEEMITAARRLPTGWEVRIGIHVGPVVAGVLGQRQYLFDLFGDTVNTAARMESHGRPGSIAVSAAAWREVADRCHGESLGTVRVKGKGVLEMFRITGFR